MDDPLELELKLELDPADRERLEAAKLLEGAEHKTQRLVSTYFDTPERDLRNAGFSLRIRRNGRKRIQTVKAAGSSSAGLFVRPEWECAIKGDAPQLDLAGGPLVLAVGEAALARIAPVFTVDMRRALFLVERAGATIELAVDRGKVRAGKRVAALCELELELRDGSPQALFDVARELNERVPLRIGVRPKAEIGYAVADGDADGARKAEPIALDRGGDAGEAFRTIVQACMRQFRLNEPLLRQCGAAEPIHRARVALRRLRSAFSLCKPLLDDSETTAMLRAELRWLAAELGKVRDLDVLIPRYQGDVRDRLAAVREERFEHLRVALDSARARLLMIDLAEWLELGAWRVRPTDPDRLDQEAARFARQVLDARRDRLGRRGRHLAELEDAGRHSVRIEAKKLRYAAEFFASLYPGEKARRRHKRFLAAVEALQDVLGELNDLAAAPEALARLGIDADPPDAGKRERRRLLGKAEKAHGALMRADRFWRD